MLIDLLIRVESISDQSAITNYSNAIWYSIVTLTSVGYGDIYPSTTYGRAIGYVFVISSLAFYGLLIGSFSSFIANLKESKKLGYNGTNFENHAVIIGWNEFGNMVTSQLLGVGKKIAIVLNNKTDIDFINEKYNSKHIFTLYSDFKNFELLKKVNIEQSSIVFVNLDSDTEKLVYILNIRKLYPDLDFVVTLDNGDLKNTFISAGVTNTISKHEISSKLLASYMFEPDVATYSESIMSFARTDTDYDIKQFLVTSSNPYLGQLYQDVFFDLKQKYNTVLIGITKRDKFGNRKLIKNPLGDLKISSGDYLLVILNGKAFKILKKVFNVEEGYFREKPKRHE
ncbi:MAG: ion channel, partial [Cyclobacteriaceae bacterium]|nr:ion channel [Cyclobacteriaceae bacterium]